MAHSKTQFLDLSSIPWKIPLCQILSAEDVEVAQNLLDHPPPEAFFVRFLSLPTIAE